MNKKKIELLIENDLSQALEEVKEWRKLLPEDKDFVKLEQSIMEKQFLQKK